MQQEITSSHPSDSGAFVSRSVTKHIYFKTKFIDLIDIDLLLVKFHLWGLESRTQEQTEGWWAQSSAKAPRWEFYLATHIGSLFRMRSLGIPLVVFKDLTLIVTGTKT